MAVYDFLLSPDGGGFAADHAFLLTGKNATKLNLERFLKRELKISVLKEDELFIYFACDGSELALDDPESGHGVFTTFFLEALNQAEDMDGNGSISLFEVYRHLYRPVQKRSSELGQRQHPQWVGLSSVPFVMKK